MSSDPSLTSAAPAPPAAETQKLGLRSMDRETFIRYLRRSGLVKERAVGPIVEQSPPTEGPIELAQRFVQAGHLTPFQASELLARRCHGFLLGPYRILERIERGGGGSVFRARHMVMDRVVALKAIPVERIRNRETRMQFRDEVRTAAKLIHPHIVCSYDANRHGNVWYLVMELVPGPNLQRLVVVNGPLAPPLAETLLRQCAEALCYAHALGVIHCDIKPANLLIANAPGWAAWAASERARAGMLALPAGPPSIKILDFGIARLGDEPGEPGALGDAGAQGWQREETAGFGTPDYVAPEQAHDLNKADARSDLYSLGCTFYFALTGRVPFPGDTALEKLIKHLAEQAAPIEQFCPAVPQLLADIIRKLMAKHPSDRFQSAAELLVALDTGVIPGPPARALSSAPTVAEIIGI